MRMADWLGRRGKLGCAVVELRTEASRWGECRRGVIVDWGIGGLSDVRACTLVEAMKRWGRERVKCWRAMAMGEELEESGGG